MAVVNTASNTPLGNQGTNQADFGGKALAGNEWTQGHPARVGDKVRRALHVQMKPLYTLEVLAWVEADNFIFWHTVRGCPRVAAHAA